MWCAACRQGHDSFALLCGACGAALVTISGGADEVAGESPKKASRDRPLPTSFQNGKYTVKEFIGEGATNDVYLVHDEVLDRDVAFALIKAEGLDEDDRKRIIREAQMMAKLGDHPNIVQIYEFGEEDGSPFMVEQMMAGGTLESIVENAQRGRVDFNQVIQLAIDVISGLEFAHSKGVIHRDVKPGNVWLTAAGGAKIGDFGIAFSPSYTTRVTHTGMVLGTVAYMPPEQAMGGAVDARSDLYSFGAMLYEMTTGQRPFTRSRSSVSTSTQRRSHPADTAPASSCSAVPRPKRSNSPSPASMALPKRSSS